MIINDKRALAHIQKIAWVRPIEGADNIELVGVLGWACIAKIGEFKEGDFCVYFEIDSKLPEEEWSEFMRAKKFKVKTMKLGKFKVVSQGLALPVSVFGWEVLESASRPGEFYIKTGLKNMEHAYLKENCDVTDILGVTYSVEEDNRRKAGTEDKYKKMAQRKPNIFRKPWARWMMKREWGRRVMFFFFGKKKDKENGWPAWVVKTDEERVQNMPWVLQDKAPWVATEKIDGTSTTFTMKKTKFGKTEFYICSRNVVFDTPDKACFYDSNVYCEMAEKYHIKDVLLKFITRNDIDFVTIQGETYGEGIQKRTYNLKGHDFMAFNLILGYTNGTVKRFNPVEMTEILNPLGIPCVPVVDTNFILPDTMEEMLAAATGKSIIDGGPREGLVFRSFDGVRSFKAVSNEFLLKYHQ